MYIDRYINARIITMGRVSLWFLAASATAIAIYYAATSAGISSVGGRIFLITSIVLFLVFTIIGAIWLW